MMQNIINWMRDFTASYHALVKETIIPSLGGGDGALIILCFVWCLIYAVGFSIARYKKKHMDVDDVLATFFVGGFLFILLTVLLFIGAAYIILIIGSIIPPLVLYFITSMILKGLDARKNIDT